jgi:hypothetical protein
VEQCGFIVRVDGGGNHSFWLFMDNAKPELSSRASR